RLVEEDDRRLVQDGAAERQTLTPSAGQVAGPGVLAPLESGHLQREAAPRLEPLAGQSLDAGEEADVLIDGEAFVEGETLRHVPDSALHAFRIAAHVDGADERCAARRLEQSAEHPDGGRLARAVRAEKSEDLSLTHIEGQMIDGDEVAEAPREILDDD